MSLKTRLGGLFGLDTHYSRIVCVNTRSGGFFCILFLYISTRGIVQPPKSWNLSNG